MLARQIGLRWNRGSQNTGRSMPFLLRCLSYTRKAKQIRKQDIETRKSPSSCLSVQLQPIRAGLKRTGVSNVENKKKNRRLLEPVVVDLTTETDENKIKGNESGIVEPTHKTSNAAFFYYLFLKEDNFPSVQVEALSDLQCPLCSMLLVCFLKWSTYLSSWRIF